MFGTALLLGGCASSDGLSPQGRMLTSASLPVGRSLEDVGTAHSRSWPVVDWWRSFGDAQLDALIDEALQGNPDLAVAEARSRRAAAAEMSARASRLPSVTATGDVQDIHVPGALLSSLGPATQDISLTPRTVSLEASYRADPWGGERAAWEAALGQQRASEVDTHAARLKLSVDVTSAYARLAHAWRTHDLLTRDAERARRLLELTKQRVGAGLDGIGQQRQAEALVAANAQQLAQGAHAIEAARIALAVLLGEGPDRADGIVRPAALQPLALAVPEDLPADLLGRRPDIVAARWRVEAARSDIEAAKADFYPSFNINAALGLLSLRNSDLLSLRSRYHTLRPAITLPIFDGGRLRAGLAGSNADFDIAVAQYNRTLTAAFSEVVLHVREARALTVQESAQRQAVAAAREAWDLVMQRYRQGISSHIEALVVEQSLLAKETTLADLHARQIDTGIRLTHALGGGYTAEPFQRAGDSAAQQTTARPP